MSCSPCHNREPRASVVDELDYEQLALKLGHSEQLIRQHVSRGLRTLRALMEEQP
jgi:DNA-directed RNA polymerase specialized sigma24 family protein